MTILAGKLEEVKEHISIQETNEISQKSSKENLDKIENFIESGICESTLIDIFSSKFKRQSLVFSLQKPYKPNIQIPNRFLEIIDFDEAKNKFESINGDEEELVSFQNSTEGKIEIEKLKKFKSRMKEAKGVRIGGTAQFDPFSVLSGFRLVDGLVRYRSCSL